MEKNAGWGVRWQLMKKNPGTEFFFNDFFRLIWVKNDQM